jgi:exosome complex component RRP4
MAEKKTEKNIVIPGELITEERKRLGQNVFVENGKVYSNSLGIVNPESDSASVVALRGKYVPRRNDIVVGLVLQETFNGYILEINSFYNCFLQKDALPRDFSRQSLKRGTVISAKVVDVDEINEASLDDGRVFFGGKILEITPVKIPRIIGKQGSMLAVIKEETGCNILAGRNGRIWVKNGNVDLAIKGIRMIEENSHKSNLTNDVQAYLKKENKKGVKK